MLSLTAIIVMLAIVVIFSVQNAGPVSVSFLSWHFEASLAIVIALALLGGIVVGMVAFSWIRLRGSSRNKKVVESGPSRSGKP